MAYDAEAHHRDCMADADRIVRESKADTAAHAEETHAHALDLRAAALERRAAALARPADTPEAKRLRDMLLRSADSSIAAADETLDHAEQQLAWALDDGVTPESRIGAGSLLNRWLGKIPPPSR